MTSVRRKREKRKAVSFMRELRSLIERHGMETSICYSVRYEDGLHVVIRRKPWEPTPAPSEPTLWRRAVALLCFSHSGAP